MKMQKMLCQNLKKGDVFAWSYKEILGLDPKVAVHHLAVKNGARPVKQAQRRFRPNLVPVIKTEVNKLIEAKFIREVKYSTWVSSTVPVRKKNGQIRVCVDFRDLNNACPKDELSLPIPELMIDATTGYKVMPFMDGSSGYNQICMAPKGKELTAFRTPKGIYCYRVMPFGLKNAGAIYQRSMQNIFDYLLHKNVECYVDDLVAIKGQALADFLADHPIPDDWELTDELLDKDAMVIEVQPPWKIYFDGVAHREGAGVGVVFVTSQGEVLPYSFTLTQLCCNNVTKYQALILGLEMAIEMKRMQLQVFGDSQLVVNQLLENPRRRTEIRHRAPRFLYYKDTLYRRSFEGVLLRCLGEEEALQAFQEAHFGVCGSHQSGPNLHFHIKRMGYYWPTMVKDCLDYTRRCKACQFHANFIHQPPEVLHPTLASWPFDVWGLDVVGPLPKSSGGHLYILAATDYFSKWVEVVALKEIKKENVISFI
ncbi:uncharacterized protein [Nicotiana tomentosiformis]|uniref:uncharacterized protein n=1 Tax=Nicotiana tomentosiformis TaxID=4098 RepID=UPI00388CDD25